MLQLSYFLSWQPNEELSYYCHLMHHINSCKQMLFYNPDVSGFSSLVY